jgi:glycine hydroxymethyltransferase
MRIKLRSEVFPGIQGGPLMHVIAAKAVAFKEALAPSNSKLSGAVLANAHPGIRAAVRRSELVSGGTDNHLMLVDLTSWDITGKDAEAALGRAGITVNKNAVPLTGVRAVRDQRHSSGHPYVTSRGMGAGRDEPDCRLDIGRAQKHGDPQ